MTGALVTRIEAISAALLPRLDAFFEASASSCYCRYWHFTGNKNEWLERCAFRPEENAAELAAAVTSSAPEGRGLVAIDERGDVVGWLKLTPRASVPKLRALPVYRNHDLGDDRVTYSIGCVLVRPDARGHGVVRALVEAAPGFAEAWGAKTIEAYPRRSAEPLHPEEAWQGPEKVFVDAGFRPVVDVAPYPVYQRNLG